MVTGQLLKCYEPWIPTRDNRNNVDTTHASHRTAARAQQAGTMQWGRSSSSTLQGPSSPSSPLQGLVLGRCCEPTALLPGELTPRGSVQSVCLLVAHLTVFFQGEGNKVFLSYDSQAKGCGYVMYIYTYNVYRYMYQITVPNPH